MSALGGSMTYGKKSGTSMSTPLIAGVKIFINN
jgi:hypothetical protein